MDGDAARPMFAEISTAFPTVPESVAASRRFVAASLRRFDFSDAAVESAIHATSEVVAHAFAVGRPPIRIRVRSVADARAAVEITYGTDETHETPESADGDGDDDDDALHLTPAGRALLESMATRSGTRRSSSGILAWFEIDDDGGTVGSSPRAASHSG